MDEYTMLAQFLQNRFEITENNLTDIAGELKNIRVTLELLLNSLAPQNISIKENRDKELEKIKKNLDEEITKQENSGEDPPEETSEFSLKALKSLATKAFGDLKDEEKKEEFKTMIGTYAGGTLNLDAVQEKDYHALKKQIEEFV